MSKKKVTASVPVELAHAKLSASGSYKWLNCSRSAALESTLPNEESKYASEGTLMHALFQHRLELYLERRPEHSTEQGLPDYGTYFNAALDDAVNEAVGVAIVHIKQAFEDCKDPVILLEQRLDYSHWVPQGFGTGDLLIITDKYTKVLDLKGGSGVFVEATDNSQFRLYGLGAVHQYSHLYDIPKVICGVLQPRLNNYQTEELPVEDLLLWADDVVVPAAKAAWEGTGDFNPGDWCSSGFCRARFTCAARAQSNLAIAQAEFALTEPELMTDEQIAKVLTVADQTISWLKDVSSYALTQATGHGKSYFGFKVVSGRSVRKYSDPEAVAKAVLADGVPETVIYERSLLGITEMTKVLGKKKFDELLGGLLTKSDPKPVLVPVTDRREAINSTASAIADFGGEPC